MTIEELFAIRENPKSLVEDVAKANDMIEHLYPNGQVPAQFRTCTKPSDVEVAPPAQGQKQYASLQIDAQSVVAMIARIIREEKK